ncbi:MAG: hypothetical protein ABSF53_00345 [Terracidiphilus sp.]|jgi:uncharacterized phage infection (PIP) family protein YhgE
MTTEVQEGKGKLEEHLQILFSLAHELERAMQAIAHNSLSELEDSVANQQALSDRLVELGRDVNKRFKKGADDPVQIDADLMQQVRNASATLQSLNRSYSALLQHSSHSVGLMVSLFSSFRGQIKEGSGSRLKHQTWSCQI